MLRRILLLVMLLGLVGFGCTKRSWFAKYYVVKAEDAFTKAYALRIKKIPYKFRLNYYREACRYFMRAYEADPSVFTLARIESATEACLRIKDSEVVKKFTEFGEEYAKKHPTEVKYGDAGAFMSLE